jgi:hypothetical protein
MGSEPLDPHGKALEVNLDPATYGTLAEIGAGQEVARWLFRVGGAAGTIAKAMSAYDMTFSDAIYGPCERYVSRERLVRMLDHEFGLLVDRLHGKRGPTTRFFVFADTVATRSYSRKEDGHGWLGVRSRTRRSPKRRRSPSTSGDRSRDGSAGGARIVGVNSARCALSARRYRRVDSILLDVTAERVEIDMIELSGPRSAVDNRLASLKLVKRTDHAAAFTASGKVVQPSDVFYKCILVSAVASVRRPGSPPTCFAGPWRSSSRSQASTPDLVVVFEMTLKNLRADGDAIDPVDTSSAPTSWRARTHVLISNW